MDIKLLKDYDLYDIKRKEGEVVPVDDDTGKRLVKLGVAERVNSDQQWLENRKQSFE